MSLFHRFKPERLQANLKMAVTRVNLLQQKKEAQLRKQEQSILALLSAGDRDEKARIQAESALRLVQQIEAIEVISLFCQLLTERFRLLVASDEVPYDMQEAVSTLIWAADRSEVSELLEVKKQLGRKFGKEYVENAQGNRLGTVNERVLQRLSPRPPSPFEVLQYLKKLAASNNVRWIPQGEDSTPPAAAALYPPPPPPPPAVGPPGGGNRGGGGGNGEFTHAVPAEFDEFPAAPESLPAVPPAAPTRLPSAAGTDDLDSLTARFQRLQGAPDAGRSSSSLSGRLPPAPAASVQRQDSLGALQARFANLKRNDSSSSVRSYTDLGKEILRRSMSGEPVNDLRVEGAAEDTGAVPKFDELERRFKALAGKQ